jgi:hypothetical protein
VLAAFGEACQVLLTSTFKLLLQLIDVVCATPRTILRDDQCAHIEGMQPGKATDVGVTAKDNRLFVEAVL